MSLLIKGLSMPEKPVTLRIMPDGKVWMMGGSDRKLTAEEAKSDIPIETVLRMIQKSIGLPESGECGQCQYRDRKFGCGCSSEISLLCAELNALLKSYGDEASK